MAEVGSGRSNSLTLLETKSSKEDDLLCDVRAELAELFLWHYGKPVALSVLKQGFDHHGRVILCADTTDGGETSIPRDEDIPLKQTERCWEEKWFVRDGSDQQQDVESFLRGQFGDLLDRDSDKFECASNIQPDCLWEALSLIVLFDQVPRFLFRNKPEAFETDHKALHFALELVNGGTIHRLPFHFLVSVLICLSHSEDVTVQDLLGGIVTGEEFDKKYVRQGSRYQDLGRAIQQMYKNEMEQVDMFGRFPDRNKILNRQSTPEEDAYLENVVVTEGAKAPMKGMGDKM